MFTSITSHSSLMRRRGFTLVEVIVVIVLLTLLSVVAAVGSVRTIDSGKLEGAVARLKTHLRYVQHLSMQAGKEHVFSVNITSSGYQLWEDGALSACVFPYEDSAEISFSDTISTAVGQGNLAFDEWGSPGSSDVTVSLTNGTRNKSITVTRTTGYIP